MWPVGQVPVTRETPEVWVRHSTSDSRTCSAALRRGGASSAAAARALLAALALGCGNEPAVGIPVTDDELPTVAREVVPSGMKGSPTDPTVVDLSGVVSREALTSHVLAYGELSPIDQNTITTITNTVEAPCAPCEGHTLASCILEMPSGCENIPELIDRSVELIQKSSSPGVIRAGLVYTDVWVDIPPHDRPVDGTPGGMPLEVWVDPATGSVRAVVDTLDALDLRAVGITFRITSLRDDPVADAWAAAAIAAEAQGKLEAFFRTTRKWRDEQREHQGNLQLAVTMADLEVIAVELTQSGLDRARFDRDRTSEAVRARVAADRALAGTLGVRVAPSWFVDGYRLRGAQSAAAIQRVINLERPGHVRAHASGLSNE